MSRCLSVELHGCEVNVGRQMSIPGALGRPGWALGIYLILAAIGSMGEILGD